MEKEKTTGMNWEEAKAAMRRGEFVRHLCFCKGEYMEYDITRRVCYQNGRLVPKEAIRIYQDHDGLFEIYKKPEEKPVDGERKKIAVIMTSKGSVMNDWLMERFEAYKKEEQNKDINSEASFKPCDELDDLIMNRLSKRHKDRIKEAFGISSKSKKMKKQKLKTENLTLSEAYSMIHAGYKVSHPNFEDGYFIIKNRIGHVVNSYGARVGHINIEAGSKSGFFIYKPKPTKKTKKNFYKEFVKEFLPDAIEYTLVNSEEDDRYFISDRKSNFPSAKTKKAAWRAAYKKLVAICKTDLESSVVEETPKTALPEKIEWIKADKGNLPEGEVLACRSYMGENCNIDIIIIGKLRRDGFYTVLCESQRGVWEVTHYTTNKALIELLKQKP